MYSKTAEPARQFGANLGTVRKTAGSPRRTSPARRSIALGLRYQHSGQTGKPSIRFMRPANFKALGSNVIRPTTILASSI